MDSHTHRDRDSIPSRLHHCCHHCSLHVRLSCPHTTPGDSTPPPILVSLRIIHPTITSHGVCSHLVGLLSMSNTRSLPPHSLPPHLYTPLPPPTQGVRRPPLRLPRWGHSQHAHPECKDEPIAYIIRYPTPMSTLKWVHAPTDKTAVQSLLPHATTTGSWAKKP